MEDLPNGIPIAVVIASPIRAILQMAVRIQLQPSTSVKRLLSTALLVGMPFAVQATTTTNTYSFSTSSLNSLAHGTAYTWGLSFGTLNGGASTSIASLENAIQHQGATVTGIQLSISNLTDWQVENADVIYVNLLNGIGSGINSYQYASQSPNDTHFGSDYFNTSSSANGNHIAYDTAQGNSLLVYTGSYVNTTPATLASNPGGPTYTNPGTWSDPYGQGSNSPNYNPNFDLVITDAGASNAQDMLLNSLLSNPDGGVGLGLGPDCHYFDNGITLTITTSQTVVSVPDGGTTVALLGVGLMGLAGLGRFTKKMICG